MKKRITLNHLAKVLIITAHLVLLGWILYILRNGGTVATLTLMLHFLGLALYGSCLIFFCAQWAKR